MARLDEYKKTYTAFSGCDIVPTFNGKAIGELQAITYSISREKAPVYTLGSANPRSFARGKRGIAGTLVFTVFNRDALIDEMKDKLNGENLGVQKFKANGADEILSIERWDELMSSYASPNATPDEDGFTGGKVSDLVGYYAPIYADEILPFDITITFANEQGSRAVTTIYGVELFNEGSGFSVDSIAAEKAYSFIARDIDYMKSLDDENDHKISATW